MIEKTSHAIYLLYNIWLDFANNSFFILTRVSLSQMGDIRDGSGKKLKGKITADLLTTGKKESIINRQFFETVSAAMLELVDWQA